LILYFSLIAMSLPKISLRIIWADLDLLVMFSNKIFKIVPIKLILMVIIANLSYIKNRSYGANNLVPTNKIDDIQIANPSSKKIVIKKYYLKMLNQNKLNTSMVFNFF